MTFLEDVRAYARLPFALKRFLAEAISLDEAQSVIRRRMERRADNFLDMVRRCIYGFPRSPYLQLLRTADCEYGDVVTLVHSKGVEGALSDLRAEGVYFTFEEFKGHVPVVRNGQTLEISPDDFDNPISHAAFSAESSGSTGAPTRVALSLDHLQANAPYRPLMYDAHGLLDAPQIVWRGILPDDTLTMFLMCAQARTMPRLWYSTIGLRDSKHWLKYDLATYYILTWMRMFGANVPFPRFASGSQAEIVARAVGDILRTHGRCMMSTHVSPALRLSLAADKLGIDFTGFTLFAGGEPPTPAKVAAIEQTGARFCSHYSTVETGMMAFACPNRVDRTDVHLFKDAYTVITHPYFVEGFDVTVPAFNLTALLPTSPKVLLNLQTDDYGIVEEKSCGCAFEHYGFTTHLRQIRSYRKLTGEGVTLIGTEMIKILEEVLPARFGGTPLDYQLLEEEDDQGFTRLFIVIHPRLAIADEQEVIDVTLDALRASSAMADAARMIWQKAETLRVRRMEPKVSGSTGKAIPLYLKRSTESIAPEKSRVH